jgi:hypothetical protein
MSLRAEMSHRRQVAILPWLGLLACSGGQTGDGTNGDDGLACTYRSSPVTDLDDASGTGFSARSVLDFASAPITSSWSWQQLPPVEGSAEVTLELHVAHVGGEVRVIRPSREPSDGCFASLELDVQVSLRTSDGAMAGAFTTTLLATSAQSASFRQTVDAGALLANPELLAADDPDVSGQLVVDAVITPLGSFGDLSSAHWYPDQISLPQAHIGSWPAASRCRRAVVVTEGTDLGGYTPAEALALINARSPATLVWQSGPATRLDFAVTPSAAPCATPDDRAFGQPRTAGGWQLSYPVYLTAASADGRWQGSYPAYVSVPGFDRDRVVNLQATVEAASPAEFAMSTGLPEVDISAFERGYAEVNLSVDVGTGESVGEVVANGVRTGDCVANPREPERDASGRVIGLPGCEATEFRPLLRGQF